MRTDSTHLSNQAIQAARSSVKKKYGNDYLYDSVRTYASKNKSAQEAHEAIRPAGGSFRSPKKTGLKGREFKLYDLIWKRTVATQMKNAVLQFVNVTIQAEAVDTTARFKANGKKILFPGFFRAYVEGSDNPDEALENQERWIPKMETGEDLECQKIEAIAHETQPPGRYTEATLVKELEKRGVGRPSTYATIISTIQDRGYTKKQGKTLIPTFTAFAVTELLEDHFPDLVDSDFTSELEHRLDDIARGEEEPKYYLKSFYKGESGLKKKVEAQEDKIDPKKARKLDLPIEGLNGIQVHVGRFGPYVKKEKNGEQITTSLPNDLNPGDITVDKLRELLRISEEGPTPLGNDPDTGENIYVLTGRYGPYVQRGENEKEGEKPKRVSLLKNMKPEDVDMDTALQLLSLPRSLGKHPETGKDVKAGIGRYGPYVFHDGTFKSLPSKDNVLTVDLNRAVTLLNRKKKGSREIKSLGNHPENGRSIKVMDGRYGPYLKYGRKNISLPDEVDPEEVTMKEATEIIDEKANKK